MLNTKRIIFILILILLFSTATQAEKEIEFWTISLRPQHDDYFLEKIDKFESENPDFKIIWEDMNFSSINQKLRYRIAEGNAPEVVNLSPQLMVSLLQEDLLYPISKLKQDYSQNYFQLLWENGFYQGEYYAFPWYVSSKLMVYNQEIFKIAGLDPKKVINNREQLFAAAEKITKETGVYALMPQIKIHHEFIEAGIDLFENENKREKAAFNTEAAKEIIIRYQELVKAGVIPKDTLNSGFNVALERYKKNDLAILFAAPQFLDEIEKESDYLREQTSLAVIPTAKDGIVNSPLMNLVIPKAADYKKEAAEFAALITSPASQREFSQQTSILSSAVDDRTELEIEKEKITTKIDSKKALKTEAQKILREQLPKSKDLTLIHPKADKLIKVLDEAFAEAFANKITAEEALTNMEKEWNQILNEENNNE
ncbi:ABC transporter substrate-binding protein [Halanaerobium congolense]|jgi:multiple sugar transport system substrate-binding protein/putative chitobiose transport system substrate-binding protein|uniref:Carbohydrate ABC transporter substrate-binding protein, CUT1 family n=1 Tax=Halanaerobium congolense TaxID=54121 RepID=A0A1G7H609_9FIRM|nr:extracellular solute-binding protein [Halanaerobium congolense]PTX17567.1 carbohydrate ABC transporter substrate-binding protein (CUT1 family) [Halanaerobium congolense]TDP12230.1 carbohydrate ABC transporter substrate-binding protein (CUT1 family) [Halanaerobium congolense]SDE95704.1 carbohydrate ABC transporter substrate-binding protein, CUT1 family [Halanaerobium congolense]SDK71488.1 carbohydrate ABC transporter substrate-binding protein, CUT1 family [Halanaerobium congolense]SDM41270.1